MATSNRILFAFFGLGLLSVSPEALAYPGAKASEMKAKFQVVASCEKRTDDGEFYYGYSKTPTDPVVEGQCPKGASFLIKAVYRPSTVAKADAEKTDVIYSGMRNTESHRAWIMSYSVAYVENRQTGIVTEVNEADFQMHLAGLRSASEKFPLSVSVDYAVRAITSIKREFSPGDGEVQITSACEQSKYVQEDRTTIVSVYGYSTGKGFRTQEHCPEENAQVIVRKKTREASTIYYQSLGSTWRTLYAYEVEIKSRYNVHLFKTQIRRAAFEKAALDFKTAAPETPVTVWVNTESKQFFSAWPTVSPYKL